jgi:hypothetical protein
MDLNLDYPLSPEAIHGQAFPAFPVSRRRAVVGAALGLALAALTWWRYIVPEMDKPLPPFVAQAVGVAIALLFFNDARLRILKLRRARLADSDCDGDFQPVWEILMGGFFIWAGFRWWAVPVTPTAPRDTITDSVMNGVVFPLLLISLAVASFRRSKVQVLVSASGLAIGSGRAWEWFVPSERVESLTWLGRRVSGVLSLDYRDDQGRPRSREIGWGLPPPDPWENGDLGKAICGAYGLTEDASARREKAEGRRRVWRRGELINDN